MRRIIIGACLLLFSCSSQTPSTGRARLNFCEALVQNDRPSLGAIIDDHLSRLAPSAATHERLEGLAKWIEARDCVAGVRSDPTLLATEPPIQELVITLSGTEELRSVGIRLGAERLRFDLR